MEHLQRVWHASRERLPFKRSGSFPHFGTRLCSNCWDQITWTCHVFTRIFTLNTHWYFLDFALIEDNGDLFNPEKFYLPTGSPSGGINFLGWKSLCLPPNLALNLYFLVNPQNEIMVGQIDKDQPSFASPEYCLIVLFAEWDHYSRPVDEDRSPVHSSKCGTASILPPRHLWASFIPLQSKEFRPW